LDKSQRSRTEALMISCCFEQSSDGYSTFEVLVARAWTFAIVFASSAYYEPGLLSALLQFTVTAACLQIGYASAVISGGGATRAK
jgi:hypothetical protein